MYLHDWENTGLEGLKEDFRITDADLAGVSILIASYTYENYSGAAIVLLEKDGKLFEVTGGHCSCHGLEEQWEPGETSIHALIRALNGKSRWLPYGVDTADPEELKVWWAVHEYVFWNFEGDYLD